MMGPVLQAAGLCVAGAVLALVVRRGSPEIALLLVMGITVLVSLRMLETLRQLLDFLTELGERSGVPSELFVPLYKTAGIALVVRVGGALCRDAGEQALGTMVEMAGTVCALAAALPLLRTVMELLMEMMG